MAQQVGRGAAPAARESGAAPAAHEVGTAPAVRETDSAERGRERVGEGEGEGEGVGVGHTMVQAQVLMRANDPLYEIAMTLGGHYKEDKFWAATLTALGQRLGVQDPVVETRSTCVDSRRQWRHANNVWHNSMIRSVLQTMAAPFRRHQGRG